MCLFILRIFFFVFLRKRKILSNIITHVPAAHNARRIHRVLGVTFNGLGRSAGNPTGIFHMTVYIDTFFVYFIPAQLQTVLEYK